MEKTAIGFGMRKTVLPKWGLVFAVALALAGCSRFGIGARVEDMGGDKYKISMSRSSDDPVAAIEAAARETCPKGYKVLRKGASAESLYGSVLLGNDLATSWTVQCLNPG